MCVKLLLQGIICFYARDSVVDNMTVTPLCSNDLSRTNESTDTVCNNFIDGGGHTDLNCKIFEICTAYHDTNAHGNVMDRMAVTPVCSNNLSKQTNESTDAACKKVIDGGGHTALNPKNFEICNAFSTIEMHMEM